MNATTRWNPWRELETVQTQLNSVLGYGDKTAACGVKNAWSPSVDIVEDEKAFTITLDAPELSLEDIDVRVENGSLHVSGERKREELSDDRKYHRVERVYGAFRRVFQLPDNIDEDHIAASLKNGVLAVSLPKTERARSRSIAISAE